MTRCRSRTDCKRNKYNQKTATYHSQLATSSSPPRLNHKVPEHQNRQTKALPASDILLNKANYRPKTQRSRRFTLTVSSFPARPGGSYMRKILVHQYSLGFLILCTLVTLRAPVAYLPNLRTPSLVYEPEPTQIPNLTAMSKARVYADINVLRPKEYWDYESLTVQWG